MKDRYSSSRFLDDRTHDILEKTGYRCNYCGRKLTYDALEIDHVIPRSQGGSDDIDNLVASCRFCNRRKGRMTPEEYKQSLFRTIRKATSDIKDACLAFVQSEHAESCASLAHAIECFATDFENNNFELYCDLEHEFADNEYTGTTHGDKIRPRPKY